MRKILTYIILVVAVCGCSTYRKYERPPITVDDTYRDSSGSDTATIASIHWKNIFNDRFLQALIDSALANNADLNIARLKVKEAEAALSSAKLGYLPSVDFNADANIGNNGGAVTKAYNVGVGANWELDIFGKVTNARRGASEALMASNDYRQAVRTRLIATVAESYYTLCMLDSQLDINKRTLVSWKETLRALEALMKVGKTNAAAILQAEANVKALESAQLSLERSITETENALSVILGKSYKNIERDNISEFHIPDTIAVGVPAMLLSNRPDVRQAERQLAQAYYATNIARAAFYPSISLSGTIGWSNGTGPVANPGQWLLNAIASLTQPLFNRGNNIANLRISEAQQEGARVMFSQTLLNAGMEVNDALAKLQIAEKQRGIIESKIATLKEAVRKTGLLMKHSSTTSYLEVLTAQQSLLDAEMTLVQNSFERIQAFINLYHALGGGI